MPRRNSGRVPGLRGGPDVTHALKAKKMTLETDKAFLSSAAGAMFSYKRYPSGADFYNVAREIVTKYPFMKSPVGKPYVRTDLCLK